MDQQYELWQTAEAAARRRAARGTKAGARRRGRTQGAAGAVTDLVAKTGAAKPRRARPVKAKPNLLPPEVTADEAFRLTLWQCRAHILANLPAVQEARAVEGMHQMRVALRRLRVALAAFGKTFRTPAIEALRMRAKILAQGLAPARDLDVFLDELFEPAAQANGTLDAFAVLRERAHAARRQAWDDAVHEVSGLAFHTFLHDLGAALDERQWRGTDEGTAVFEAPARQLADHMLARRLKGAKARARKLETLSEPERHQLRIALKKLRYACEFFASLYPEDGVKPFLKRLAQMQDILGLLQDVAVARKTLAHLVEEPAGSLRGQRADLSFAAGIVYGWHLDRASQSWQDAVGRWKKFAKTEPFWERG